MKKGTLLTGLLLLLGIGGAYASSRKKELSDTNSGGSPVPDTPEMNQDDLLITNFDSVWDYYLNKNKWYTRKKGTSNWLDMKASLSDENYKLAVSRLEDFIKKNNLQGLGCSCAIEI